MTQDATTGPGRRELREEAADWFVRMREPESAEDRVAFERWLAEDPLHRDAYNRIGEVFSLGKGLGKTGPEQTPDGIPPVRRRRGRIAAGGLTLAALLGVGVWTGQQHLMPPPQVAQAGPATQATESLALATPVGAIRSWRLPDGSHVTLDTGSALQLAFTANARTLRLLRGRARFDVAHEARPFQVMAGAGTVTAHGTLFDVSIRSDERVSVRLLRGAIDVALAPRAGTSASPVPVERLHPGEQVIFDKQALAVPMAAAAPPDGRWPEATLDCDRTTLASIVHEANRYSATQIEIGDPALSDLRVSGSFRIDDPDALARHLAALFDLKVEPAGGTRLVLKQS